MARKAVSNLFRTQRGYSLDHAFFEIHCLRHNLPSDGNIIA